MPDSIFKWLVNYLDDRRHVTSLEGLISSVVTISVVLGSDLGPSKFISGAADLHPVHDQNRLQKYADDSYLIIGSWNIRTAQNELQNITCWAKSMNLHINQAKIRDLVVVQRDTSSLSFQPSIKRTTTINILGVAIVRNWQLRNTLTISWVPVPHPCTSWRLYESVESQRRPYMR